MTYDQSGDRKIHLYVNGTEIGSYYGQTASTGAIDVDASSSLVIGLFGAANEFDGTIDEVRVSDDDRSAAWISSSYYSESNDLLSFGGRERYRTITPVDDPNWYSNPIQQNDDVTPDAINIQDGDTGNPNNHLTWTYDIESIDFKFHVEGVPNICSVNTYAIVIDTDGDGTYDYVMSTYSYLNGSVIKARLYKWHGNCSVGGTGWDDEGIDFNFNDYVQIDNTQRSITISIDWLDIGIDREEGDSINDVYAYAVTYGRQGFAFADAVSGKHGTGDFSCYNDPRPNGDHQQYEHGDWTDRGRIIPEFSEILPPIVFTFGVVALFVRKRRKRAAKDFKKQS